MTRDGAGRTIARAPQASGGELVAEVLLRHGVRFLFTLCGGHVMSIYDGCLDEGIGVVDVRHEQSAAHAADGWARVTGKPGVAIVTAGPGLTDAVTGVATAWRARKPSAPPCAARPPPAVASPADVLSAQHKGL